MTDQELKKLLTEILGVQPHTINRLLKRNKDIVAAGVELARYAKEIIGLNDDEAAIALLDAFIDSFNQLPKETRAAKLLLAVEMMKHRLKPS